MNQFKTCTHLVFRGFDDSLQGIALLRDSKVQREIGRCCAINGIVFILSSTLFKYMVLGFIFIIKLLFGEISFTVLFSWVEPYIFKIFIIIPLFLLSKFVWIILDATKIDAYRCRHLRAERPEGTNLLAWTVEYTLDPFISVGVQICFLLQILIITCILNHLFASSFLPYIVLFVHMCIFYSLFAFEFVWFSKGWEMNRRLNYIEENWLYFVSFGVPLTILTEFPDSWFVSGLLFAVMLPIFIMSGSEADSANKVSDIFPLRIFFPTRIISFVPLFIMTKRMCGA